MARQSPEFVGLALNPYLLYISFLHHFLEILFWGLLCVSIASSFQFMCHPASLVLSQSSLSQHFHEGDYFWCEQSKSPSILDTAWVGASSHLISVSASQFLSWELPRISVAPGLGHELPLPSEIVVLLLNPVLGPATGLPLHSYFLLSSVLHAYL